MEYAEISALFTYWENNPPTHMLVQGLMKSFGVMKDKPATEAKQNKSELSDEEFHELSGAFGT